MTKLFIFYGSKENICWFPPPLLKRVTYKPPLSDLDEDLSRASLTNPDPSDWALLTVERVRGCRGGGGGGVQVVRESTTPLL